MKKVMEKNSIFYHVLKGKFSKFSAKTKSSRKLSLPKQIGVYRLLEIVKHHRYLRFQLGIYQDNRGNKFFAKQFSKINPGPDYYWLSNEINVYSELNSLYAKYGEKITNKFPRIKIPKLVKVFEDDKRLIMLLELVGGTPLHKFGPDKAINIYDELFEYFKFIGSMFDKKKLGQRTNKYFLLTYPILALKSFIKYPYARGLVVRSTIVFFSAVPTLLRHQKLSFVHRDLNQLNILLDKETIWLIDFEYAVLTNPLIEVIHVVMRSWHREDFRDKFINSWVEENLTKNFEALQTYKSLALYSAMLDLAVGDKVQSRNAYSFISSTINLETS